MKRYLAHENINVYVTQFKETDSVYQPFCRHMQQANLQNTANVTIMKNKDGQISCSNNGGISKFKRNIFKMHLYIMQ